MGYKSDVSSCETVTRVWTQSAIDCYEIGCICAKCHLYKIYFSHNEQKCYMKKCVIELVRKFGVPQNNTQGENND